MCARILYSEQSDDALLGLQLALDVALLVLAQRLLDLLVRPAWWGRQD